MKEVLKMIKKNIIMWLVFFSSAFAAEPYQRAIDMKPGSVIRTARLARSVQEFGKLSKEADGLGEVKNIRMDGCDLLSIAKENKTVYVVLNRSPLLNLIPDRGVGLIKFPGSVDVRFGAVANHIIQPVLSSLHEIFDRRNDSIVIVGTQDAGSVACLLGFGLHQLYQGDEKFKRNQLKIITFCSAAAGDTEFVESIHGEIGQGNILNFYYYLSPFQNLYNWTRGYKMCGVPLKILPSEQLQDTLGVGGRRTIRFGLNLLVCGLITCSAYTSIYSGTSHQRTPESSSSVIERSKIILASRGVLMGLTCMLVQNLFLRKTPTLPTDSVLISSFTWAQEVLSSDRSYSLDEIGIPPLFSSSRGVGGYLETVSQVNIVL